MEVSGVRSSWVTESSRAVRRRSVSLAASERALSSRASARSMDMETRPLRASMVSRERQMASSSRGPQGRTPMRSGTAVGRPSAGEAEDGQHHGVAEIVHDVGAAAVGVGGAGGRRPGPGDLGAGDALGVGEIDAVAVGDVEGDGGGIEGVGDAGGDEVEQLGDVLGLEQLAAEAVKHLGLAAAGVGVFGLLTDAARRDGWRRWRCRERRTTRPSSACRRW